MLARQIRRGQRSRRAKKSGRQQVNGEVMDEFMSD